MAKKKRFAGKKTKLAQIPLTEVLSRQMADGEPWATPSPAAPSALPRQLPLSFEEAGNEAGRLLTAGYFQVITELSGLLAEISNKSLEAEPALYDGPPASLPPTPGLKKLLLRTCRDLQEISLILQSC
jgi:hypothetical protein